MQYPDTSRVAESDTVAAACNGQRSPFRFDYKAFCRQVRGYRCVETFFL